MKHREKQQSDKKVGLFFFVWEQAEACGVRKCEIIFVFPVLYAKENILNFEKTLHIPANQV